ncbi:hypothetical protein ABOM_001251 [Aspergillus bombycis]|uniref:Uncharacterized protein n=1 Tax=Aspergillus bombycis TaxID=109264 RepID=A0A1F8AEK0_9EURO|nr:hypothetical protein ABOM_001251 [Aspergillus bombycis]OGM50091.1 hypothetical protein ABOM_001251 [Aspergillus bombycis]
MYNTGEKGASQNGEATVSSSCRVQFEKPFSLLNLPETLWLFTDSDFATFVIPDTAFGIFAALSAPVLSHTSSPDLVQVLERVPAVMLWNWLNLLIFDLANQRHPESVTSFPRLANAPGLITKFDKSDKG